jgi:hypothetical protein
MKYYVDLLLPGKLCFVLNNNLACFKKKQVIVNIGCIYEIDMVQRYSKSHSQQRKQQ